MNSTVKHLLIWVVTIACLLVGWQFVYKTMGTGHDKATSLTETLGDAEAGFSEAKPNGLQSAEKLLLQNVANHQVGTIATHHQPRRQGEVREP